MALGGGDDLVVRAHYVAIWVHCMAIMAESEFFLLLHIIEPAAAPLPSVDKKIGSNPMPQVIVDLALVVCPILVLDFPLSLEHSLVPGSLV